MGLTALGLTAALNDSAAKARLSSYCLSSKQPSWKRFFLADDWMAREYNDSLAARSLRPVDLGLVLPCSYFTSVALGLRPAPSRSLNMFSRVAVFSLFTVREPQLPGSCLSFCGVSGDMLDTYVCAVMGATDSYWCLRTEFLRLRLLVSGACRYCYSCYCGNACIMVLLPGGGTG